MAIKTIGIYKITSPSEKIYIGQSKDFYRRWGNHKVLRTSKQPRLYNSLLKYGIENHTFEVIEECDFEQLNIRERYWQDFYDVTGESGMNCSLTATDILPRMISEITRQKLRDAKLGEKNPMYGRNGILNNNFKSGLYTKRKYGPLEKRRVDNKGENNPFYGKKHTDETKEKLGKKVIDTATSIVYNSLVEIENIFNIKKATLSAYLLGKINNKTTFLYLCEVEKLYNI